MQLMITMQVLKCKSHLNNQQLQCNLRGLPSAISMAVIPTDHKSHWKHRHSSHNITKQQHLIHTTFNDANSNKRQTTPCYAVVYVQVT